MGTYTESAGFSRKELIDYLKNNGFKEGMEYLDLNVITFTPINSQYVTVIINNFEFPEVKILNVTGIDYLQVTQNRGGFVGAIKIKHIMSLVVK